MSPGAYFLAAFYLMNMVADLTGPFVHFTSDRLVHLAPQLDKSMLSIRLLEAACGTLAHMDFRAVDIDQQGFQILLESIHSRSRIPVVPSAGTRQS